MSMALMSELGLSSWSDFVANVRNSRNRRIERRKKPGLCVAEKAAKESEVKVSVDPTLILDGDDSGTEDLFADIDIPSLMEFFDHEEVIDNFLPDLFDSC